MRFESITRLGILTILVTTLLACGSGNNPVQSTAPGLGEPEFIHSGLDDHIVEKLIPTAGKLFAATDKGLYRLNAPRSWELLTQAGWHILDAVVISDRHLLASITNRGDAFLAESTDGGQNWTFVEQDFGGMNNTKREPIHQLFYDTSTQKLYGIGYAVLAVSTNLGRQWQVLDGQWFGFARGLWTLNLHDGKGDLWYGGQGAIENPVLKRFAPATHAMAEYPQIDELLQKPSTIKSIRFHPGKPERVYVSGEGGLILSTDYGETWQGLHVNTEYRFYFDLLLDLANSDILYTAGWNKKYDDPQPLRLEISRDGGQSWQQYEYGDDSLFGGVYSMAWHQVDGQNRLYLGLYKGGVMEVRFQ